MPKGRRAKTVGSRPRPKVARAAGRSRMNKAGTKPKTKVHNTNRSGRSY